MATVARQSTDRDVSIAHTRRNCFTGLCCMFFVIPNGNLLDKTGKMLVCWLPKVHRQPAPVYSVQRASDSVVDVMTIRMVLLPREDALSQPITIPFLSRARSRFTTAHIGAVEYG